MTLLFYLAGAIAIIATFAVIVQTNIVHALLYLILSLLAVAVIFYAGSAFCPQCLRQSFTPVPYSCCSQ